MPTVKFRLRRDTAANWTSLNPVLALAEPGLETDTHRVKYGDGTTAWNSLPYSAAGSVAWSGVTGTPTTLSGYGITDAVPNTRTVSTTSPLTGGGALSADLTLGFTGAALTKADDTNVTLTLGGTPSTALASAVSLTLGWTGTLAVSRGGTGGGTASGTLLDNITGFSSTGMIARTGSGSYSFRTITGTSNEITVTNGSGVSGNPTLSLPSALTFTGKTITGGTFSGITLSGNTTLPGGGQIASSTGWIGIGTSPGYALHVSGAQNFNNIAVTNTGTGHTVYFGLNNAVCQFVTDDPYVIYVASTESFRATDTFVNVPTAYRVANTKVVGARKTGWATASGTATRTTFDTGTVTLQQLAERLKALIDDLHATAGHGLIGS